MEQISKQPIPHQLIDHEHGRVSPTDRSLRLGDDDLVFVSGPAGWGKTALLSRGHDQLVADGIKPSWIDGRTKDSTWRAIEALFGEASPMDRVLFVDNADHLDEAVVSRLLHRLSDDDGPRWRLILAGRRAMDLPLDAIGSASTRFIDGRELALDESTMTAIITSYQSDPAIILGQTALARLVRRLDGWAAGAHLAGRVIGRSVSPDDLAERIGGADAEIAEYLETEVFSALHPSDQEFLIRCSVLLEPDVGACEALTGDRYSGHRLARLVQLNAFVSAGPDRRGFVWQPMVRQFLMARLNRRPRDEIIELRDRAGEWSSARHHYDDVVLQAVSKQDWRRVVDVVLEGGMDTVVAGRASHVVDWVDRLPPRVVEREAGVAVVAAMALWASRGLEARQEIDDWLLFASANRAGRAPRGAASIDAAVDIALAAFGSIDPRTRIELAERAGSAEAQRDPASPWAAMAYSAWGFAAYLDDDQRAARQALAECLRIHASLDEDQRRGLGRFLAPSIFGLLALIEIDAGESARADVLISSANVGDGGATSGMAIGPGTLGLAQARRAAQQGDDATALAGMADVASTARQSEVRVLAEIDRAILLTKLGRADNAEAALTEADRRMDRLGEPGRLLVRWRRNADRHLDDVEGDAAPVGEALTERELEVLRLLDTDLSRREIAERLFLAHNTVKTYVQRLYQKLGVSSRPAAVSTARERGWIN